MDRQLKQLTGCCTSCKKQKLKLRDQVVCTSANKQSTVPTGGYAAQKISKYSIYKHSVN